jgi:F-type H+-transporting ATPase subunit a
MPHGHSWFDVLLGTFYENVEAVAHVLGWPFNDEGKTWYQGDHIGVQHVWGSVLVLIAVGIVAFGAYRKIRDTHQAILPEAKLSVRTFVEIIVSITYGMMSDMMGPKAAKYFLPLIGTCAFLIFFSNVIGLIPGFLPPTDNLRTTGAYAIIIFVLTHVYGVREHGIAYFKHFLGPIIKWYALPLMILMLGIEVISHIVRPITLAVRLAANMTADHLVLTIFIGLVPFVVPIPMYMLGVIVVTVQTLVFCLLSSVYISMAIAHEEH